MMENSHATVSINCNEYFDVVVMGAGISGLVSAAILAKQGCRRVLLVDEYDHPGGNHLDWSSNGYTFDIGSLIFQDDSPLLRYFPELLPLYVPINPQWARLTPQGRISTYPISIRDDIIGAGVWGMARIFASLMISRLFTRKARNAQDFVRFWIGGHLSTRSGLESYMHRFYGVPPREIDIDLARKRMLWISEHASLGRWLKKVTRRQPKGPANRQLARPREGFSALYEVAVERLRAQGVETRLGAKLTKITKIGSRFALGIDAGVIETSRIISTIPLEKSIDLCGLTPGPKLATITLIGLFFSFAGTRGFQQSVIYNFSHEGRWKRLTMYSDFYGVAAGREYFGVEVVADDAGQSIERAERAFREHVRSNGLFIGELRLEGSRTLSHAYPIYRGDAAKHAAEAIEKLRGFGVESLGRQGGFNYQPTARSSTVEAETALHRTMPA